MKRCYRLVVSISALAFFRLGTIYDRKKDYLRPRLRIRGTTQVLVHISQFLSQHLNIGKKKVQNLSQSEKAKVLYYHSKAEIPEILLFVGAMDSLEKFYSLRLGYGAPRMVKLLKSFKF